MGIRYRIAVTVSAVLIIGGLSVVFIGQGQSTVSAPQPATASAQHPPPVTASVAVQTAFGRGHRFVDQSDGTARVIVALNDTLKAGEVLQEQLPVDASVSGAWAARVDSLTADSLYASSFTAAFQHTGVDGEYRFTAVGATTIAYTISRSSTSDTLVPGEVITGSVTDDIFDEIIENCWDDLSLTNIVEQVDQCIASINATIAGMLCEAFSVLPGSGDSIVAAPYEISFDDSGGPFSFSQANHGVSKMSVAIGDTDIDSSENRSELMYMGQTLIPFMQGEFSIGARFEIVPNDSRNANKRAAATVAITGGNPGANPYGYEGWMAVIAANPFVPFVVPAMAVVADRIDVEFLRGFPGSYTGVDSDLLNSELLSAIVAAPGTADSDDSEPQASYSTSFNTYLTTNEEYIVRGLACTGAIVEGIACAAYNYYGNAGVPDMGIPLMPVETVTNEERGLRLEDVTVDFHHMELVVDSIRVGEHRPLDGTVVDVLVGITNTGTGDGHDILVTLYDDVSGACGSGGVPVAYRMLDRLDAGQDTLVLMSWYTCGGFYGGLGSTHYLGVEVESMTIAEIDYTDNCMYDTAPVEVQPSVMAAFISEWDGAGSPCWVELWNTRLRMPIGRFDVANKTTDPTFNAHNTAVSTNGRRAWVIMDRQSGYPGLIGVDVKSCWSGDCDAVGVTQEIDDMQHSGYLKNLAVNKQGTLAFCPYNTSSGVRVAIFPLDSVSGVGMGVLGPEVTSSATLHGYGQSAISMATTGTMCQEAYLAPYQVFKYDTLGWIRVTPSIGAPDDPNAVTFDTVFAATRAPSASAISPKAPCVDFAPEACSVSASGARVYRARGDRAVFWADDFSTTNSPAFETVMTRPRDDVYAEVADNTNAVGGVPEIVASHTGRIAWAIHENTRPTYFYSFDPSDTSETATLQQVATDQGAMGDQSRFRDLAFKPACADEDIWGDEVWFADSDYRLHIYDESGAFVDTISTERRPQAITIEPIPHADSLSIAPAPLPGLVPGWPLDLDPDYDFVGLFFNGDYLESETYIPIMNPFGAEMAFELEFDFSDASGSGWTVTLDPADPITVPAFNRDLANIRFVQALISVPAATGPTSPALVRVRAVPTGDDSGRQTTGVMLRCEEIVCACDCHADPACDGMTNVLDVVKAVDIAFRGGLPVTDPNPACPYTPADVDCNGFINVLDVVKLINVGFRGGNPAVEFCDPCP